MTTNNSLVKALSLLDLFTPENPVMGLNEIVKLSGFPKATVYRMLISLEETGFLTRSSSYEGDRRYKLGIKLFELGMMVYNDIEISKIALPIMENLRNETGEAVQLAIPQGEGIIYIEKVETEHIYRLFTTKGARGPLHAGASGLLLLSGMQDSDIDLILLKPLKIYTKKTPSNKEEVLERIALARQNGYCVSIEELWPGTAEVSAPVYEAGGNMVATISIAGPLIRMDENRIPELIEKTKLSSNELSYQLGFTKPYI